MPETVALPNDTAASFGTFERRTFPLLSQRDKGYWWRVQLVEHGVPTPAQAAKGYGRIPCNPEAQNGLFMANTNDRVILDNGANVKVDEYLGASLKEYISLLAEIFHNHNRKIDASTAPLSLPQTGMERQPRHRSLKQCWNRTPLEST